MRKTFLLAVVSVFLMSCLNLPLPAQDRSQAQSEVEGRSQSNSQAQSQAVTQGASQAQSQATSQAQSQQVNTQMQNSSGSSAPMQMNMPMQSTANPAAQQDMTNSNDGSAAAMQSMEGHHMDMGPHMKMTALRAPQPGDAQRAAEVVESARKAAIRYADYRDALADGYHIFLPNVPQKQYHFTNNNYAIEAAFRFNPDHPTSLLYQKVGDGYKLIGVMYTARKTATEDELNERIPLSIAQWHAHVNLCLPPLGTSGTQLLAQNSQFGLRGSISTKEACDAAGGRFMPQIFGWMVHVYPFEKTPEEIWSVERQAPGHEHMD